MRQNQQEKSILAQNSQNPTRRRYGVAALAALPFLGVVTAFGLAPETDTRDFAVSRVVESIELPNPGSHASDNEVFLREERIQRGDTVGSLLGRLQVSDESAQRFLRSDKSAKPLHQLRPGRTLQAETNSDGKLLSLRYVFNDNTAFSVTRQGDQFDAREQALQLEMRPAMKSGIIKSSLYGAADAARIPDAVTQQMTEIFGTDIDFHTDLRKGDRFTVVYETFYERGTPIKTGRVLAAEFNNAGKNYRVVFFVNAEGQGGYYTADGKNLRQAFLRSPLEFSRISSGFTIARFHPIFKQWTAHSGVDFAAPTGTRIKVTADGVVDFVGKQNGYGNVVIVKHQNKYSTLYAHMSGFANGIKVGQRVTQGDVLGFVGATGWATGPHLHYEFRIDGKAFDPLGKQVPMAMPIDPRLMANFHRSTAPLLSQLDLLRGTNLARLD